MAYRRFGGAERDRTADLLVANEALSQLSYSPTTYLSYQRAAYRGRALELKSSTRSKPQGLNVVSQDVLDIEPPTPAKRVMEKMESRRALSTFPQPRLRLRALNLHVFGPLSGAEAPISFGGRYGTAKAVPFQSKKLNCQQRLETLQLKPEQFLGRLLPGLNTRPTSSGLPDPAYQQRPFKSSIGKCATTDSCSGGTRRCCAPFQGG